MINYKEISNVCEALIVNNAMKAVKYVSPKSIIRAVRKTYKYNGRKINKELKMEVNLTIGHPNYREREFVRLCQQAKEPFPVKKIQLKYPPKKKEVLKGKRK